MSELDDDDVVGLDSVDNVGEAAFDGVGARAATADSLVDDSRSQRVREVSSPACPLSDAIVILQSSRFTLEGASSSLGCCHGRVSSKVDSWRTLLNAATGRS